MKIKSFRIGEYALGGIIKVTISQDWVEIKALDWNTKKVVGLRVINFTTPEFYYSVGSYLNELTTSYYTEKIVSWIRAELKYI